MYFVCFCKQKRRQKSYRAKLNETEPMVRVGGYDRKKLKIM